MQNNQNPFANNPFMSGTNPFATQLADQFSKGMDGFMKYFAPNASGPFGIPTFNPATEKLDKEFSWGFDPKSAMKGIDLSKLKDMFPADFMKSWQDMFQSTFQNASAGNFAEMTKLPKMGGVDWQSLMDSQKRNMEACVAAHHTMQESMQQLSKRQGEIFRETMQSAAKLTTDFMETGTPEEKLARQVDIAKQAYDILGKHMRELATLTSQSQAEAMDLVSARVQTSLDELKETAKKAESSFHSSSVKADKTVGE